MFGVKGSGCSRQSAPKYPKLLKYYVLE